jgi:pimeloyl-ACP methyl ester carboxylesterase
MNEQFADLGEVTLCYETFGDPNDPTVLLIMGLATQMIGWPEDFCRDLASRGFHVVRFDNRDAGRSTHIDAKPPTVAQIALRSKSAAAYSLGDMAGDAAGLIEHLGAGTAHVVGASMGGMVAQMLAIRHPDRVASLVSIMSNIGDRFTGQPAFAVYPILLTAAPSDREEFADSVVKTYAKIASPGFDNDHDEIRRIALLSYDRGRDRAAPGRQLQAIVTSGSRRKDLKKIDVPTLVIHGTADKLVRPSGGSATARAIPGAKIMKIEGMGHDLPRGAWPQMIDGIVANAERAGFDPRRPAAAAEAAA